MAQPLPREAVIAALHAGISKAARRFASWSKGGQLREWGVESVMTVYCAEAIMAQARKAGSHMALTIEQPFGGLLSHSERQRKPGRPDTRDRELVRRSSRRVDIVLWNAADQPRAVIEIKRSEAVGGIKLDALRVLDFLQFAGRNLEGSIRYGLLAVVIQCASRHGTERLDQRAQAIGRQLVPLVRARGLDVKIHGPLLISRLNQIDCLTATIVIEFN